MAEPEAAGHYLWSDSAPETDVEADTEPDVESDLDADGGADTESDVEAAWSDEIKRRVADLDAGTVETIPWEEVRRRLLDRLNAR